MWDALSKMSKVRHWCLKFTSCPKFCSPACQISIRFQYFHTPSHGFETLQDLTIRQLMRYWKGPLRIFALSLHFVCAWFEIKRKYRTWQKKWKEKILKRWKKDKKTWYEFLLKWKKMCCCSRHEWHCCWKKMKEKNDKKKETIKKKKMREEKKRKEKKEWTTTMKFCRFYVLFCSRLSDVMSDTPGCCWP